MSAHVDLFNRILQDHKELMALPQTLSEVLRVAGNDTSSASELSQVLSRDPALTTKLLRVVNSPFYGVGREIGSVKQAVMTVGQRSVTALALSTSVYDLTGKWSVTIDRKRFWRHSLEVAIGARLIAEEVKYPFPDEAFVAGLLHDIGLLVMEKSFNRQSTALWKEAVAGTPLHELERTAWGTDHAKAGQFLFEQWNLPKSICQAVGEHHDPLSNDIPPPSLLGQIVMLANLISRFKVGPARSPEGAQMARRDALLTLLSLKPTEMQTIEKQLLSKAVAEAAFLEMEIGNPEEILAEANRLLYDQYLIVETLLRENRKMQEEIARAKVKKAALEALQTITATFNHYINNASATILGRAQLVEVGLQRGEIVDPRNMVGMSMQVIVNGVNTISAVMHELKNLAEFETTCYHDSAHILDIEARVKNQIERLKAEAQVETEEA